MFFRCGSRRVFEVLQAAFEIDSKEWKNIASQNGGEWVPAELRIIRNNPLMLAQYKHFPAIDLTIRNFDEEELVQTTKERNSTPHKKKSSIHCTIVSVHKLNFCTLQICVYGKNLATDLLKAHQTTFKMILAPKRRAEVRASY